MTGMVYVAVILNGVTLVSPDTVPADKCEALKKYNTSIIFMCIDKEEDCGTVAGLKRCHDYPAPRTKSYARKR